MGYITGNTNEFVVYLTDAGKDALYRNNNVGGLADLITQFSLSDTETNYNVLADSSFDPNLVNQNVIGITNSSGYTNGFKEVFTVLKNRGDIIDNKNVNHALLGINKTNFRDFILYNPELNIYSSYAAMTYKDVDPYRQYDLSGLNGIYLRTAYGSSVTLSDLIQNFDLYPVDNIAVNKYHYINSKLQQQTNIFDLSFIGSNALAKSTDNLAYSQIIKGDELVMGENYHAYFDFYFRFYGAENLVYNPTGTSENLTINLFIVLGTNKVPMTLSNLQQYRTTGTTYNFTNDILYRWIPNPYTIGTDPPYRQPLVYLSGSNQQITLNYSERSYSYLTNSYMIKDHFDDYNKSPIGYNFRVKASLDLSQFFSLNQCKNTKDFSILVQYSKLSDNYIKNTYVTHTYTL